MYNTDNQIQNFETMPGENKANISPEKAEELAQNAEAWENAMADFTEATESVEEAAELGDDARLEEAEEAQELAEDTLKEINEEQAADLQDAKAASPENDFTPRLNDPSNPVAHAFDEAWRDGQGGISLENAYDGIRTQNSAESIQVAAQQIQPEIATITRENSNTGDASVEAREDGVSEDAAEKQNLEEISEAATAIAIGAQAEAEQAVQDLNYNRITDSSNAESSLAKAEAELNQLASEARMSQNEQPGETQAQRTSEDILSQAIDMVNDASDEVSEAADRQEERLQEAEERKEEVERLREQRAEEEQETKDKLGEEQNNETIPPIGSEAQDQADDTYANGDIFNTNANDTTNNPEYIDDNTAEQENEDEPPRQSIFG